MILVTASQLTEYSNECNQSHIREVQIQYWEIMFLILSMWVVNT